jgi:hypothetical protein
VIKDISLYIEMSFEEEIICYSELISCSFSAGTEESLSQDNRFTDPRVE